MTRESLYTTIDFLRPACTQSWSCASRWAQRAPTGHGHEE